MKRNRVEAVEPKPRAARSVHLSDYLAILRDHKWVALVPFLLIVGGSLALTLLATPVYKAEALIEIDSDAAKGGLLGDLQLLEGKAKVEAEMEIMRSRNVARDAAERLRDERHSADFLVEVNAYRPLEVLIAAVRGSPPRCDVEIEAPALAKGRPPEAYLFRFVPPAEPDHLGLEIEKIHRSRFGSDREMQRIDIVSGAAFRVFDRCFSLTVDGDPVGREYQLTLRNSEDLANWLRAHTTVSELGRNTGIVALGFKAETPRLAEAGAWALANAYAKCKEDKKFNEADKAVTFLKGRLDDTEEKLEAAEDKLDKFRSENGVTLLSERAKVMVERTTALRRERTDLELQLEEHERLARRLADPAAAPESLTDRLAAGDPTAAALASQVATLQLEEANLPPDATDEHPQVKALKERIAEARDRLRVHLAANANVRIEQTHRRIDKVDDFLREYQDMEDGLPEKERQLANFTRQANALLASHAFLLEKKHEAEIARESTFSNVEIVDLPVRPKMRTSPNLVINVAVGLLLAILAALATAFFAEYLDRSVKTPEELEEATGLPLYAALPAFKSIRSRDLRRLKTQMVTIEKPNSVLAEGYRSLRANVKFADFESPVRAFAITSAVLGEGKTTTTLNLAVVLAQGGSRVVVVDADLRRPATHVHLKGKLAPGLTDVLRGRTDWRSVVRPVEGVEKLQVIHAGEKVDNPSAMLDSERFQQLLAQLRDEFDYVIFDVPPVLAVSDAAAFFSRLDAVFLLVQWRRCPIDVVLAARDQIERLNANLRGVVFNGFDARKSNRRGYGRYGYYGYYGGYRKYGYGYGYGYGATRDRRSKVGAK